jgi:murein L,D-transpeptidase YcbB/YkuD
VYLHDTPEKSLFANTRRDFSHGCIRLQDARDLAVWVTSGQPGWNADSVDAALAAPQQRRVTLTRTIPVFIEYNTALATVDGLVWFLPDVYRRDHEVTEVSHGPHVKTP